MNKSVRNGLIFLAVLIAAFFISQNIQKNRNTESDVIFDGDTDTIAKILIQKGDDALELARVGDSWSISGNDTLIVRKNRIDNFFDQVLPIERQTMVSRNIDKWPTYAVDDSTGTHLALIDEKGETIDYFVFGRSKSDWSHNYVRIQNSPNVYLTSENILHHLSPQPTFWGEVPPAPEPDSLAVELPMDDIEESDE